MHQLFMLMFIFMFMVFFYIIVPFKLAQAIDVRGLKQVLKFVEIQTKRFSHRKVWMHVSVFCSWSSTQCSFHPTKCLFLSIHICVEFQSIFFRSSSTPPPPAPPPRPYHLRLDVINVLIMKSVLAKDHSLLCLT